MSRRSGRERSVVEPLEDYELHWGQLGLLRRAQGIQRQSGSCCAAAPETPRNRPPASRFVLKCSPRTDDDLTERDQNTTESLVKPSTLASSAGWLIVILMLLLASPGVRTAEAPEAATLAQAESRR